jgi:hypothetical protein
MKKLNSSKRRNSCLAFESNKTSLDAFRKAKNLINIVERTNKTIRKNYHCSLMHQKPSQYILVCAQQRGGTTADI